MKANKIFILFLTAMLTFIFAACSPNTRSTNTKANTQKSTKTVTKTQKLDANEIAQKLKEVGMPIGKIEVYNESNDPNKLLGRPGQYTSKANFVDTRINEPVSGSIEVTNGGSIEVFDNKKDADSRYEYISNIAKQGGIFAEYDFQDKNVILRISNDLTPEQEKEYEITLQKIIK